VQPVLQVVLGAVDRAARGVRGRDQHPHLGLGRALHPFEGGVHLGAALHDLDQLADPPVRCAVPDLRGQLPNRLPDAVELLVPALDERLDPDVRRDRHHQVVWRWGALHQTQGVQPGDGPAGLHFGLAGPRDQLLDARRATIQQREVGRLLGGTEPGRFQHGGDPRMSQRRSGADAT
jgi:hypothetical protein